jgi:two-component system cell cycle sensor histidine kinase PleC
LTNAVKFTPENGRVVLNATIDDGEGLIVRVEDNGIGMTPEELAKALTKFGQVDSKLSRKHEGSGLGLTLASGLAEALGGRLDIVSTKGQGTTAILTFPPDRVVPSH